MSKQNPTMFNWIEKTIRSVGQTNNSNIFLRYRGHNIYIAHSHTALYDYMATK